MALLFWVFASTILVAGSSAQPLMQGTSLFTIDLDGDGRIDFDYAAEVFSAGDIWYVATIAIPTSGGTALRASKAKLHFVQDAVVSSDSPVHSSPAGPGIARLVAYIAFPNPEDISFWLYQEQNPVDSPRDALVVFVGVKFPVEGAWHYGWLKFTRPNGRLETLFDFDNSDWNPIPDAPIRAGQPPEIPIMSERLPPDGGFRLSWPPGAASWVLESAPSLAPPVLWEPYPLQGTYADVPLDDDGRFFRLRRP